MLMYSITSLSPKSVVVTIGLLSDTFFAQVLTVVGRTHWNRQISLISGSNADDPPFDRKNDQSDQVF